MPGPLLDSSTVIALLDSDHPQHADVVHWKVRHPVASVCPIGEGAFVRHLLRAGWPGDEIAALLRVAYATGGVAFVADDLSYAELDAARLRKRAEATDAYLVGLAAHHGTHLVTLDRALAAAYPERTELIA